MPARRNPSHRLVLGAVAALLAGSGAVSVAAPPAPYQRPGRTELVTVAPDGGPATYPTVNLGCDAKADLSADGRHIVFNTDALNLTDRPGGTSTASCRDIFWRDLSRKISKRVNVSPQGAPPAFGPQGGGVGGTPPSISADGRFIAFANSATNLVPGDTNLSQDVFVRDTRSETTTRVSVGVGGAQSDGASFYPSISGDGRYVAFASGATNLVPGDTNGKGDVFVFDMKTRKTRRVSVSSSGAQATEGSGGSGLSINTNGRFVAFTSSADNLVPGDTTNQTCRCLADDVFRRDLVTGRIVRVSVASDGRQASFAAFPTCVIGVGLPVTLPPDLPYPLNALTSGGIQICRSALVNWGGRLISDDGRFVMFTSNATNLVPNDTNFGGSTGLGDGLDAFVHDTTTRRTERVSLDSYGHENKDSSWLPALSGNGRLAVFATTVEDGGTCTFDRPPVPSIERPCQRYTAFAYDRLAGAAEHVLASMSGAKPKAGLCKPLDGDNADGQRRSFGSSRDGRYVAFYSSGQDIAPGDTNNHCDYFVRDRGTALGVGAVMESGSGTDLPSYTCIASLVCIPPRGANGAAELRRASVVTRPALADLYVRWDLQRLAPLTGAPAGGILYGLRFSAGGHRYEVRTQRVPGVDYDTAGGASFGLFRQDAATGHYLKLATLKGGYGTIGESVVAAVPLAELGLAGGGTPTDVTAFTAVGTYATGATSLLDSVALTPTKAAQS